MSACTESVYYKCTTKYIQRPSQNYHTSYIIIINIILYQKYLNIRRIENMHTGYQIYGVSIDLNVMNHTKHVLIEFHFISVLCKHGSHLLLLICL